MVLAGAKGDLVTFADNLISYGRYGVVGSGTGTGTSSLQTYLSNYDFRKNALFGPPTGFKANTYPLDNLFPVFLGDIHFVALDKDDYHLAAGSPAINAATDGKNIGADIDAVLAAVDGVV